MFFLQRQIKVIFCLRFRDSSVSRSFLWVTWWRLQNCMVWIRPAGGSTGPENNTSSHDIQNQNQNSLTVPQTDEQNKDKTWTDWSCQTSDHWSDCRSITLQNLSLLWRFRSGCDPEPSAHCISHLHLKILWNVIRFKMTHSGDVRWRQVMFRNIYLKNLKLEVQCSLMTSLASHHALFLQSGDDSGVSGVWMTVTCPTGELSPESPQCADSEHVLNTSVKSGRSYTWNCVHTPQWTLKPPRDPPSAWAPVQGTGFTESRRVPTCPAGFTAAGSTRATGGRLRPGSTLRWVLQQRPGQTRSLDPSTSSFIINSSVLLWLQVQVLWAGSDSEAAAEPQTDKQQTHICLVNLTSCSSKHTHTHTVLQGTSSSPAHLTLFCTRLHSN